jgi:hypothetical protein
MKNLFSQFFLLAAISSLIYLAANLGLSFQAKTSQKLERVWQEDLHNLAQAKKLPSFWFEIRSVEKVAAQEDSTAEDWALNVSTPIEINLNGKYKLEILFLSQNENGVTRAVIQHHIIHIPTGNSVWELGRTYILN